MFTKQRNRLPPTFANINLLGKCNVDCYFCLGKDIPNLLHGHDQTGQHYKEWPNFDDFLDECTEAHISKIYITGQNTDALLYKHLEKIVGYLQDVYDFGVGIRTNGYLALNKMDTINQCKLSVGYSIHTFRPRVNKVIMGTSKIPDWDRILQGTLRPRVSMVIGRYNTGDFWDVLDLVKMYPHIRYLQVRRISTDTRQEELTPDAIAYESFYEGIKSRYPKVGEYYGAPQHQIEGVVVTFWRTVQTQISSFNYFTDGTVSKDYFVVEGYRKCQ